MGFLASQRSHLGLSHVSLCPGDWSPRTDFIHFLALFHAELGKHVPEVWVVVTVAVFVIMWDFLPGTVAAGPVAFLGPSHVSLKRASHPALEAAPDTLIF